MIERNGEKGCRLENDETQSETVPARWSEVTQDELLSYPRSLSMLSCHDREESVSVRKQVGHAAVKPLPRRASDLQSSLTTHHHFHHLRNHHHHLQQQQQQQQNQSQNQNHKGLRNEHELERELGHEPSSMLSQLKQRSLSTVQYMSTSSSDSSSPMESCVSLPNRDRFTTPRWFSDSGRWIASEDADALQSEEESSSLSSHVVAHLQGDDHLPNVTSTEDASLLDSQQPLYNRSLGDKETTRPSPVLARALIRPESSTTSCLHPSQFSLGSSSSAGSHSSLGEGSAFHATSSSRDQRELSSRNRSGDSAKKEFIESKCPSLPHSVPHRGADPCHRERRTLVRNSFDQSLPPHGTTSANNERVTSPRYSRVASFQNPSLEILIDSVSSKSDARLDTQSNSDMLSVPRSPSSVSRSMSRVSSVESMDVLAKLRTHTLQTLSEVARRLPGDSHEKSSMSSKPQTLPPDVLRRPDNAEASRSSVSFPNEEFTSCAGFSECGPGVSLSWRGRLVTKTDKSHLALYRGARVGCALPLNKPVYFEVQYVKQVNDTGFSVGIGPSSHSLKKLIGSSPCSVGLYTAGPKLICQNLYSDFGQRLSDLMGESCCIGCCVIVYDETFSRFRTLSKRNLPPENKWRVRVRYFVNGCELFSDEDFEDDTYVLLDTSLPCPDEHLCSDALDIPTHSSSIGTVQSNSLSSRLLHHNGGLLARSFDESFHENTFAPLAPPRVGCKYPCSFDSGELLFEDDTVKSAANRIFVYNHDTSPRSIENSSSVLAESTRVPSSSYATSSIDMGIHAVSISSFVSRSAALNSPFDVNPRSSCLFQSRRHDPRSDDFLFGDFTDEQSIPEDEEESRNQISSVIGSGEDIALLEDLEGFEGLDGVHFDAASRDDAKPQCSQKGSFHGLYVDDFRWIDIDIPSGTELFPMVALFSADSSVLGCFDGCSLSYIRFPHELRSLPPDVLVHRRFSLLPAGTVSLDGDLLA